MITLLGTNHVSPRSVHLVRQAVEDYDIVAIELDKYRLQKLFSTPQKPSFFQLVKAVGLSGAIFAMIGHAVENKLGAKVGMLPGDEMRVAVHEAALANTKVALIDQPINITLQKFSKAFTFKVKWKLFKLLFKKTDIRMDPYTVPDANTTQQLMKVLDENIPELAEVLLHQRNRYMSNALVKLQEKHPEENILAVVGAGHVPGMSEELKKAEAQYQLYE